MAQSTRWVEPLPAEAVAAVRAVVAPLVERVVVAVAAEDPVYGAVLTAPEGIGIRIGIEQAVRAILDAAERGQHPDAGTAELWRRLGEAEFEAGRSLEALRRAFRIGTRAAWHGAAEVAAAAGISTSAVISLAEAIFLYTDELAAEVVEGYLRMQSDEAGEIERRRRRLVSLLLDPDGADPEAVARAAGLARWTVPQELAILAVEGQSPGPIARRLSVDALVGSDADGVFLILPDPTGPGRAGELARACAGIRAALGPNVGWDATSRSLRWARRGLDLVRRGVVAAEAPLEVECHLALLTVLADEELAAELVRRTLAPVAELPEAERDRLMATLGAWLDHQRHVPAIASALHVHPQTVRYRLGKLRELLGDGLDTPDGRFALELALRARRALAA